MISDIKVTEFSINIISSVFSSTGYEDLLSSSLPESNKVQQRLWFVSWPLRSLFRPKIEYL